MTSVNPNEKRSQQTAWRLERTVPTAHHAHLPTATPRGPIPLMNDASPRLTERGRQRRRAMLDAATQAFLEHGFEGTTLDMVIERAGGSRGTLYSSFGG